MQVLAPIQRILLSAEHADYGGAYQDGARGFLASDTYFGGSGGWADSYGESH
jgi:hypothetical protein